MQESGTAAVKAEFLLEKRDDDRTGHGMTVTVGVKTR
jgi:hypothetical protein